MIDEERLIYEIEEDAETRLLGYDGGISLGEVKEWVEKQPKIGVWIPIDVEEPKDEYLECFVTARLKTWTDPKFSFTTKATWIRDGWYWKNGKPMKNRWDILAWQKIKYPKPYKGE